MQPTLAIVLRAAQLFAHNAHNLAHGDEFFADHAYLGELYEKYEETYDSVVERMIGLGETIDLTRVQRVASNTMDGWGAADDCDKAFGTLMRAEKLICGAATEALASASEGTKNFLQGICDESEMRQYKIGQRLKPDEDGD